VFAYIVVRFEILKFQSPEVVREIFDEDPSETGWAIDSDTGGDRGATESTRLLGSQEESAISPGVQRGA
jgi:hypothetical protein